MTWREDLRRVSIAGKQLIGGSFRGVPFLVESEEVSGGRRAVVHEFPFRDDPYVEDLGRAARGYRVEAYVIGDDYLQQRDALIEKLDGTAGSGELVLPGYGTRRAVCLKWATRSTRSEGGIAMLALDFADAPAQAPTPTVVVDAAAAVAASADAAATAADAEFVEQYDADGLPAFAVASAETAITRAADALERALAPVVTSTQERAELAGRVALLTAQAASLVRQPTGILGAYRETIQALVNTVAAAPGPVMAALVETYSADLGPVVDAITATRERELANQTALTAGLRRVVAIEAARLAPLVSYASIEEAMAARNEVAALIEEQEGGADDTAYPALTELRTQVLRAVPGSTAFARVVTVTRSVSIPSLLLAYQLYGAVDLEADLIARNSIRHPGFVAGDLKVLSDG